MVKTKLKTLIAEHKRYKEQSDYLEGLQARLNELEGIQLDELTFEQYTEMVNLDTFCAIKADNLKPIRWNIEEVARLINYEIALKLDTDAELNRLLAEQVDEYNRMLETRYNEHFKAYKPLLDELKGYLSAYNRSTLERELDANKPKRVSQNHADNLFEYIQEMRAVGRYSEGSRLRFKYGIALPTTQILRAV